MLTRTFVHVYSRLSAKSARKLAKPRQRAPVLALKFCGYRFLFAVTAECPEATVRAVPSEGMMACARAQAISPFVVGCAGYSSTVTADPVKVPLVTAVMTWCL